MRVLAHFDRAAGQVAESIALEPGGGVVIGMIPARQVVRVTWDGAVRVLATMPLPPGGGGTTPVIGTPVVTGVARSDSGATYLLYTSGQGGLTGIWQLGRSGEPRLVVPLPADTFPNALVIDDRRDDSIAVFAVEGTGGTELRLLGHHPCGGSGPRHICLDAEERWMYAANQNSGSVAVFARDAATGALTPVGEPLPYPQVVCVIPTASAA